MRSEEPTLEELFAATRTLERRATPERQQLRKRVAGRLAAAGLGLSHAALAAGGNAGTTAWLTAVKLKLLVGAVVVGGALGGHELLVAEAPRHSPLVTDASGSDRARSWQHLAESPRVASLTTIRPSPPEYGTPSVVAPHGAKPTSVSARDTLTAELQLLRAAQGALAKGEPQQGLELLGRYFQRFPSGILQPEAKVTHVRALCQAGRAGDSKREAERFSRSYPDSPLAKQLRPCQAP